MTKQRICSIPECGIPNLAKGLCEIHYRRLRRHGDPLLGGTYNGEPQRFYEEVVLKFEGDECLTWPYGRSAAGYGQMRKDGVKGQVSRFACQDVHGQPPTPKHEAAHSCGKGHIGCVNPKHLSWKTPKDNHADKLIHGTHNRGSRHGLSKLSDEIIREIRALKGQESQEKTAERYKINRSTVSKIQLGKRWSWIGSADKERQAA